MPAGIVACLFVLDGVVTQTAKLHAVATWKNDLVEAVRNAGLRIAVVSASKNSAEVLRAAGIEHRFEERVDSVEDALAGVEAGRNGEFGWVVGVDRVGHAEALRSAGADRVVRDLSELLESA
jgi:beta-phosphoglucomutase-like phosphatase (HAD superfamily)